MRKLMNNWPNKTNNSYLTFKSWNLIIFSFILSEYSLLNIPMPNRVNLGSHVGTRAWRIKKENSRILSWMNRDCEKYQSQFSANANTASITESNSISTFGNWVIRSRISSRKSLPALCHSSIPNCLSLHISCSNPSSHWNTRPPFTWAGSQIITGGTLGVLLKKGLLEPWRSDKQNETASKGKDVFQVVTNFISAPSRFRFLSSFSCSQFANFILLKISSNQRKLRRPDLT